MKRAIVMGAAGRDFHDFLTFFRSHPDFHVMAFTATQIPFISQRRFPKALAGPDYDADIPIEPEERLAELIREHDVEFVFLSYSDLDYRELMHKQSIVQAAGASFVLLGPRHTELSSQRPVIAVVAVRTGAGKSPLCHHLASELQSRGRKVAVIRHPMPYGDLDRQVVERFGEPADLDRFRCTIEEREEYSPYLERGLVVFAGVDYERVLRAAETDADVILWDGGNNDYPFVRADFTIVLLDALRPGHEIQFYPGETNLRRADVVVINKVSQAKASDIETICGNARERNPDTEIVQSDLEIEVDDPERIRGQRVLVIEDGPTLTHGGLAAGAGVLAAERSGALELVDPRPHAVGSIKQTFLAWPHLGRVLPAMGYSEQQREDLAQTIHASGASLVVDASPARIDRVLSLKLPVVRVSYRFRQRTGAPIEERIATWLARR